MDAVVDQETGVRGYLIAGNERFLEPYRTGVTDFNAALQKAKDLTQNSPEPVRLGAHLPLGEVTASAVVSFSSVAPLAPYVRFVLLKSASARSRFRALKKAHHRRPL
jgi:hypothetical protein